MLLNRKNSFFIPLYFTFSVSILLIMLLISFYTETLSPLLEYVCTYLLATLIISIKQYGVFSIFNIFFITSFFFLYDCLFFTLIGTHNFLKQTFPTEFYISKEVGRLFLIAIFLFVSFSYTGYSFFVSRGHRKHYFPQKNVNILFCGKILFFIFLIPSLIKIYIQIKYLQSAGYVAMFLGGLKEIEYPFFCTGALTFLTMGYCLILCSIPNKKQYLFYTVIFVIVYMLNAIKGQRGPSIAIFIISIFIYTKYYGVKISLKKILILFGLILLMIISLEKIRDSYGSEKTNIKHIPIIQTISNVLYYQTTTRAVPLLVIQGNLPYHKYPFVFSPLLKRYYEYKYGDSYSRESAMHFNNISQVTMSSVSMNSHLKGLGYGGAILAEAYDFFGLAGVILFALFLAKISCQIDSMSIRLNRYNLIIMYFILVNFATLARGRFFDFLAFDQEIFCTLICLSIVQCGIKYLTKR